MPALILPYRETLPQIDPTAFVAETAVVIGDVTLGPDSGLWYGCVVRGDVNTIRIGARTNIQDGTVIHCSPEATTVVGDRCVVGHQVHLEGCVIEDDCLIGSGTVIVHHTVVGRGTLVGAQAMVPGGLTIPPRSRVLGVPARITEGVIEEGAFDDAVERYVAKGHRYAASLRRLA